MLDDLERLSRADDGGFLARLAELPGSYDGPDGMRPAPYALSARGEARVLEQALAPWFDARTASAGSLFVLAAGFDFTPPTEAPDDAGGADRVVIGWDVESPDFHVDQGVLSLYTYTGYLAHATGRVEAFREADAAMRAVAQRCGPAVASDRNLAKTLAWTLWNRVPLLLSSQADAALQPLIQQVFARVGKTLAVPTGEHPLVVVSSALEGRHQLGDDLVGLVLGVEDAETTLLREVAESRVAQIESLGELLDEPRPADAGAAALVTWYAGLWVAAYLALLYGFDPAESAVYRAVGASL